MHHFVGSSVIARRLQMILVCTLQYQTFPFASKLGSSLCFSEKGILIAHLANDQEYDYQCMVWL